MDLIALQARLDAIDVPTRLAETRDQKGGRRPGPILAGLEDDEEGRERILLIDFLDSAADEPARLLRWRHVYPIDITLPENFDELARALWILNRVAEIGHNGFCEDTPALYWEYVQVLPKPSSIDEAGVREMIGVIDTLTQLHGGFLAAAGRGEMDCDAMRVELRRIGLAPGPLFFDPVVG